MERDILQERWEEARPWADYLDSVERNRELWHGVWERARLPDDVVERAREIGGEWHLLALSEDWCGDAVNLLPVVARFAEALPNVELRVLSRDENPALMDAHLTDGRSRSIPVVILLDESFEERGWWGPRPTELQSWVLANPHMESAERYKEVRRWYARDRGRTVIEELVELICSVGAAC